MHGDRPNVIETRGKRLVRTRKQRAMCGAWLSGWSGVAENKRVRFQKRLQAADYSSSVFVPWIVVFDCGDFSWTLLSVVASII